MLNVDDFFCCFPPRNRVRRGQEHGELELRSDLLDCHVDVCSPEVLVQLSDNFDYQVRCNDHVHVTAWNNVLE